MIEKIPKKFMTKIVVLIGWAFILFCAFYVTADLNPERLLGFRDDLQATVDSAPLTSRLLYFALYIIVTSLSLPGALVMTLLGGAIFGLYWGVILVSFASSIGATIAFLISRRFLQGWVVRRYSRELSKVNSELRKDGALYLFGLRMVPAIPFFVVNMVMGVTEIRVVTFYVTSQLAMLLATVLFVFAGTQLVRIDNINDLLSPLIFFVLVLLGVFPLAAKKIINCCVNHRHGR